MTNIYYIPHAKTCELAHTMTIAYCQRRNLNINSRRESGYTKKAEEAFNIYIDLIEGIMLSEPIKTLKEFKQSK